MRHPLNESQEKALDLSRHLAVTAAAGSGKTTVLVERYLRILQQNDFRPEQIVAITFTEEAATQMRDKIRRRVTQKASEGGEDSASWSQVGPRLALSKITTIHGFCLSILREYPLHLGLDPGFLIPAPALQEGLLKRNVRSVVDRLSLEKDLHLQTVLDSCTTGRLSEFLAEMLRRRNYLPGLHQRSTMAQQELLSDFQLETATELARSESIRELQGCLDDLPPDLLREKGTFTERCLRQRTLLRRRSSLSSIIFIQELNETFATPAQPTGAWRRNSRYQHVKSAWDRVRRLLKDHPLVPEPVSREADAYFSTFLKSLLEIHVRLSEQFENEKFRLGVTDFEDLLALAREAVRQPQVADALRARYRFYLLDEAQDTNLLQWQILEPLIQGDSNFFCVGDPQQSIYRFRDADVAVFQKIRDWVGESGQLSMPENYRSLPAIVEFTNRVFAFQFQKVLDFEAAHLPMKPSRLESSDSLGKVEALIYEENQLGGLTEAAVTARWVSRLLRGGGRRPRDIAILLRSRTHLDDFEQELSRRGVPYESVGAGNFFRRQEVMDLHSLLRFIADPSDEVGLVGALRSPLLGFSDEDLLVLSLKKGSTLWEKLLSASAGPRHWRFGRARLQHWLSVAEGLTVSQIMNLVLAETGLAEVLRVQSNGSQALSNLEKLGQMARDFDASGRRTLREWVRFLDDQFDAEVQELEHAPPEQSGDAVRIFTIHGAKGLEFPVVILPELGASLTERPKDRLFFHRIQEGDELRTFLAAKICSPQENFDDLRHPTYTMLRALDRYRQTAEEKRLLYVAMTRARDHLILLGLRTDRESYSHWLLQGGVESCAISQDLLELLTEEHDADRGSDQGALTPATPVLDRSAGDRVGQVFMQSVDETPAADLRERLWTPTDLTLMSRCPRRYFYTGLTGLPEVHPFENDRKSRWPSLLGTAVHDLIETHPDLTESRSLADRIGFWVGRLARLGTEGSEVRQLLLRHLGNLRTHPLLERWRRSPVRFSEREFSVVEGGRHLAGVIDKLFQEEDGSWTVIDFKTNRLDEDRIDRLSIRDDYRLQVELYLFALARILGTREVQGFLFFTWSGLAVQVSFDESAENRCLALLHSLPERVTQMSFPLTQKEEECRECGFFRATCGGAGKPEQGSLW